MGPSGDTIEDAVNSESKNNSDARSRVKINALPRTLYASLITYSRQDFQRADSSPDAHFYVSPRFVQHIDEGAIAALKSYYGNVIKEGTSIVDLCSSWTSHLPEELKGKLGSAVGYGLNGEEMRENGWLTGFWVRDLNAQTGDGEGGRLLREIEDGTVDVVICNVSIDYLLQPVVVLEEVKRVLKVGGTAHMAFSNRCFPTKVIGRWLRMTDQERRVWVGGYFWAVGGFEGVEDVILKDGKGWGDPLFVVRARKGSGVE